MNSIFARLAGGNLTTHAPFLLDKTSQNTWIDVRRRSLLASQRCIRDIDALGEDADDILSGAINPGVWGIVRIMGSKNEAKMEANMRESFILFISLVLSVIGLAGCELAGDIFKAGVWVGALLVIGIIAVIIWMVSKAGS